jgi:hypothetical protein
VFGFLHETHELAVAWLAELDFEECTAGGDLVTGVEEFFGFGGEVVAELGLAADELFDEGFVFVELVGGL